MAISIPESHLIWDSDYEAVSDGSRKIQCASEQERNFLQGSASDWLPTAIATLENIKTECCRAGWDGSGGSPVTDQTIGLTEKIAEALFEMLPRGIPAPDLIPEADGEICISWSVDTDRLFSLSVGAHGKINFAGQFGNEGGIHGWQPIDATSRHVLEKSLQDVARRISRLYASPVTKRKSG